MFSLTYQRNQVILIDIHENNSQSSQDKTKLQKTNIQCIL